MCPWPSAEKRPGARKAIKDVAAGFPAAHRKAYWPFKLALEKFPVGGGGGGPTIAVLLPHAAQREASSIAASGTRCLMERFIARLPAAGFL